MGHSSHVHTANDRRERESTGESAEIAEGDYVRIEVSDTGTGIPPEIQARIFEPFFSTKASGSGLGLPIVHAIVTQHGGAVGVEASPLGGARFWFTLPRAG